MFHIPSQLRLKLPLQTDVVVDVWDSLLLLSNVADGVRKDPKTIGTCTQVVLALHPRGRELREAYRMVAQEMAAKKRQV